MSIKTLPSEIADQIAAGEVVERPASVIKELVENSIDGGATIIVIKVIDGGKQLLSVTDNGMGMSPDDAEKSVLRHATSKINTIQDLFSVNSFGFRGEALAAISSVSEFTLITKKSQEKFGTKVNLLAGKDKKVSQSPANTGTMISVENLFFPTPVRLKHLKQSSTEFRYIWKEIQGFALAFPKISFEVYKNEKLYKNLPSTSLESRIQQLLEVSSSEMVSINSNLYGMNISGFIIAPGQCQTNKNKQYFFVNGRRVEDFQASYALREAYIQTAGIEKHLHPVFALFLEIDPLLVDINIHPRKREVKFSEPREVFSLLKRVASEALEHSVDTAFFSSHTDSIKRFSSKKASYFPGISFAKSFNSAPKLFSKKNKERNLSLKNTENHTSKNSVFPTSSPRETEKSQEFFGDLKLIGQVSKKYILAESEHGVYFFDQHALHERERFEVFWDDFQDQKKSGKLRSQALLVPEKISLELDGVETLFETKNKKELEQYGFHLKAIHEEQIEVLAVPQILEGEKIPEILAAFSDHFLSGKIGETSLDQIMRKRLEYKSCRGAVMFGESLSSLEMQRLLDDFKKTKWRNLCPHGRPNHWFVPFSDLNTKFHR